MGYYNSTLDSKPYIADISLDIFCHAVSVGLVSNLIYAFHSLYVPLAVIISVAKD